MPADMKKMIADSLTKMLKERRNIDKITVKDLVETCNISRQSFYYHFQDILEVMEWLMDEEVSRMVAESLKAETPEGAMRIFISATVQNRDIFSKLITSKKREQTEKMLINGIKTWLKELAQHRAGHIQLNVAKAEAALNFCTYGIAGMLLEYCTKDGFDIDVLSGQIAELLSGVLENAD